MITYRIFLQHLKFCFVEKVSYLLFAIRYYALASKSQFIYHNTIKTEQNRLVKNKFISIPIPLKVF